MRVRSVNGASAMIAAAAAVVAAATAFVCNLIAGTTPGLFFIISSGLFAFLFGFVAARLVIRSFIIYKIKPIYQIALLRDLKLTELKRHLSGRSDVIERISAELSKITGRNLDEIERLRDNEKYRREFVGNVSHELKTPIFTLQGYILTLLDGAVDDPAINRKYLERAEKSIDRMISIVTDLEEISKLESGVLNLKKERFDIAEMACEVVEDTSLEAEKFGITIQVANGEVPVWVTADRKYIANVISNLVVNSIRYGRQGGKTRISFADMSDRVMVEVSDNGIGIAAEDIPRVFERFYRTDKSRSREIGGTGLGLSIVKHVIEAHGQKISLKSKPDEGSTFSFTVDKG